MLWAKKNPEKTVLVVDVENGSVGGALVRLSPQVQPKLFAEKRVALPVPMTRSSDTLFKNISSALEDVLRHNADVAGRLRAHERISGVGEVSGVSLFFSAPWGVPNLAEGTPTFVLPMVEEGQRAVKAFFGPVPTQIHTTAGALVTAKHAVLPYEADALLMHISGEVSELMLLEEGVVVGYATVPHGLNSVLRTLQSHAGLSEAEARSALLHERAYGEAHTAAAGHFAEGFKETAQQLFGGRDIRRVFVTARRHGDWFARALSSSPGLEDIFPQGGTIRALTARHVMPHFAAHAPEPDLMLMLQALFAASAYEVY